MYAHVHVERKKERKKIRVTFCRMQWHGGGITCMVSKVVLVG